MHGVFRTNVLRVVFTSEVNVSGLSQFRHGAFQFKRFICRRDVMPVYVCVCVDGNARRKNSGEWGANEIAPADNFSTTIITFAWRKMRLVSNFLFLFSASLFFLPGRVEIYPFILLATRERHAVWWRRRDSFIVATSFALCAFEIQGSHEWTAKIAFRYAFVKQSCAMTCRAWYAFQGAAMLGLLLR